MHCIAARHHIISHMPDEARDSSILCCRIMSGMSIIDPTQPSVSLIWYPLRRQNEVNFLRPLVNMSYGLTFDSGKLWAAEQLDAIATRYLHRNARLVAQRVRQSISQSQFLNLNISIKPPPPLVISQDKLVGPNLESWPSSSDESPHQTYMTEGKTEASTSAASMVDFGVKNGNHVLQNDPRVWNALQ